MKSAIRQSCFAAERGAQLNNEATSFVADYCHRKQLAEIGFTDDLSNLDSYTADCFIYIGSEFNRLANKRAKARNKKR